MRKLALLLAAGLIVSVPLAATVSTDSYAAAKKAKKAAPSKGSKEIDPGEANGRFAHALADLAMALGTYVYYPPGMEGPRHHGRDGHHRRHHRHHRKG